MYHRKKHSKLAVPSLRLLAAWTTTVFGSEIQDPSGLGRWSGVNIRGRKNNILSLITGYPSCSGSKFTAPLGSTFNREYEYLRNTAGITNPNPRLQFLKDVEHEIRTLQESGNMILLMLDANGVCTKTQNLWSSSNDSNFTTCTTMILPRLTYIGSTDRRIDFMFGCTKTREAMITSGTLSYIEGPQSDHRGLFVDLDPQLLLQHNAYDNTLQNPVLRPLKSGNPELVAVYHEKMIKYYDNHNMINRINHLYEEHTAMK
jgi:hypothetical protein